MRKLETQTLARSPTSLEQVNNRLMRLLTYGFAYLTLLLVFFIVFEIGSSALPAVQQHGWQFLTGTTWDPNHGVFGVLPEIWGTLFSSTLALIVGTILGVAVAIFLCEGFLASSLFAFLKLFRAQFHPYWGKLPEMAESLLKNLIQLLAAIPSVVYGLWGIFVIIPMIRPACNWTHEQLNWVPFFSTSLSGPGILPASIVLAIMILPTISALSLDALVSVPPKLRDASYGLGATRWETIFRVMIPTALPGIFGSIIIAFGRALGETMALAMLAGNANQISLSLFSPANTLAALLANNFPEAGKKEVGVLMYAALVLLAITLLVNMLGAYVLQRASVQVRGVR